MKNNVHTPKYIQICIKRMYWHRQVVRNNLSIVENWIDKNKIDKNIPLEDFINISDLEKKEKIIPGQLSIFDYLEN